MLLGFGIVPGAHAQVAGSIDIESDYRLRGYSLSAGQPTATAQISYDDDSGLYLNLSATDELTRDGARFLGVQGNIGYVRRLSAKLSIDGGVTRTQYRASYAGGRAQRYTEIYLGFTADPITARIYFSPDYYRAGVQTIYGEVEGVIHPMKNWRLSAHIGSLSYLSAPSTYFSSKTRYDWRLGLSRQLGNFDLHAAVSGGGPGQQYYYGHSRDRTAVTAGASWNF
ncbi:TorF family putative porin [Sphingomonas sp.]|uniref:TorF family putative porin n=1 Tax=Sphingomonas sp. TaxID=28214 RepID=UPI002E30D62C|nr:TorF family putative porin [Sphingomonas sp.]HEX4695428.1 TorF family putative porin [Sphingomonas sp.]